MFFAKINGVIHSKAFQNLIIVLIVLNTIVLALETSNEIMESFGAYLKFLDRSILLAFVLEIIMRISVHGTSFFKKPWNVFDFLIVAVSFIPAGASISALRAFRIFRVLRLLSTVPTMQRVVESLLTSIPGIASVLSVMLLVFFVFAVIGTHLYGATYPDWFGSLGKTMFSLFQIMTLESWSMGIVRPVMQSHPYAWAFFVVYILSTTFILLNLFIAIMVNTMHSDVDKEAEESRNDLRETIKQEVLKSEKRLAKLIREKQLSDDS